MLLNWFLSYLNGGSEPCAQLELVQYLPGNKDDLGLYSIGVPVPKHVKGYLYFTTKILINVSEALELCTLS